MFIHTISRLKRSPFYILAMVLFSAVLAAVLCMLNKNVEDEITAYEDAYATIPVKITVCDLTGRKTDEIESFDYVVNVFRSEYELGAYIKDPQFKMHLDDPVVSIGGTKQQLDKLVGITSLLADPALEQNAHNNFSWLEGYDEDILGSAELVCVIPEKLMPESIDGSPGLSFWRRTTLL